MSARTHRCRRSCDEVVRNNLAFCLPCWRSVPGRVKKLVYKSYDRVQRDPDAWGEHAELLSLVRAALEGERPWESVLEAVSA